MKRILLALALFGGVAEAQPPGQTPSTQNNRREAIKKKIRIMRGNTLTVELHLDEPAANKLFPLLARYDDELDKLLEQKVALARRLREAKAGDSGVDKLVDEAVANQKALWGSEEHRLQELRKILTPVQVAKLLVALPEFERKIQNQLRKAIEKQQEPADDDDLPDAPPPPRKRRAQP